MNAVPESFALLLYRRPAFFRALGVTVYKLAGLGLIAGAFAQISQVAASVTTGFSGQPAATDIALLFPGIWTWWIPETFAGVAAYVLLSVAGVALAEASKNAQRHLRSL